MMLPDTSGDEHEIMFDDEDDDDDTTERHPASNIRSPATNNAKSNGIQSFQPLAGNINEAVQASLRLESFLSSNTNETTTSDHVLLSTEDTTGTASRNDDPMNDMLIQSSNERSALPSPPQSSTYNNSQILNTTTTPQTTGTTGRSFDPYAIQPLQVHQQQCADQIHSTGGSMLPLEARSLLDSDNESHTNDGDDNDDDTDIELATVTTTAAPHASSAFSSHLSGLLSPIAKIPGTGGFLEMEEEPPRTPIHDPNNNNRGSPIRHPHDYSIYDPIQTSSGLLLTHRRVPPSMMSSFALTPPTTTTTTFRTQFEIEGTTSKHYRGPPPTHYQQQVVNPSSSYPFSSHHPLRNDGNFPSSLTPILRYVRMWMVFSAAVLLFGTMVLLHHTVNTKDVDVVENQTTHDTTTKESSVVSIEYDEQSGIFHLHGGENIQLIPMTAENDLTDEETEQIILLPLPPQVNPRSRNHRHLQQQQQHNINPRRMVGLPELMQPDQNHNMNQQTNYPLLERTMRSLHTLQNEFDAWMIRHDKSYGTEQERHHRFQIWSHNHERTIEKNERHGPCAMTGQEVFGSNHLQDLTNDEFESQYLNAFFLSREPIRKESPGREEIVLGVHVDEPPAYHPSLHDRMLQQRQNRMGIDYQNGCKWYDVSCILRYLFSKFLYGLGGTMEPAYDANSYPTSMDWRSLGAVTDIHSQSSCGACWAITAVETVESAYFISNGKLYDLAETEVIVCETNGEMCAGGWPQDAFDYVIKHNGLPLESDMTYNADFLVKVSDQIAGNSDQLVEQTVSTYQQQTCPSGGGNDNHSGDSASVSGSNTFTRYGKIKGYGYSTSKCVCYTDGSGCDCDHQNEGYAVRNVATYGPAVVCLDASTWQDYTGGIITSDSGCSSGFMDVNHCVQAVGYAYISDEEYDTEVNENQSGDKNQNSRSGSGSRDSTNRKGYWIVRNQWSTYWGMNGYAYVAMGDNTCGILNDMLQAYT